METETVIIDMIRYRRADLMTMEIATTMSIIEEVVMKIGHDEI